MAINVKFHPNQDTNKGSTLNEITNILENLFNIFTDIDIVLAKNGFQIDYALGNDLELLVSFLNIERLSNETDIAFRKRIKGTIRAKNPVTIDAIQDMFEIIIGLRPIIKEDFFTRVYRSGEILDPTEEIATFRISFNADIARVAELDIIDSTGNSLKVQHTSNIDPDPITPIEAYDDVADPPHTIDISDSLDSDTGIMILKYGPYLPNTKIAVYYDIIPIPEYDGLIELSNNIPLFNRLVNLAKAAGIKTGEIDIVKFFNAWYQNGGVEILNVTEINYRLGTKLLTDLISNAPDIGWDGLILESNTNGVALDGTGTFTSIGALFLSKAVAVDELLIITSGADVGTYTIDSIDGEEELTVSPNFSTGGSGQTYEVYGKGARWNMYPWDKPTSIASDSFLTDTYPTE